MKKCLVIGATGFVGRYLVEELHKREYQVYATSRIALRQKDDRTIFFPLDILDKEAIADILLEIQPDYIFHLAAQSSVGDAWRDPVKTVQINIEGSINLLDAVRDLYYRPRILLIGSGEEYGYIQEGETPIKESNAIRPGNIYAVTKACQNMIGNIYTRAYDMELIQVRAFNHIGPGQEPLFVVSDFCKQVAEIEKKKRQPVIKVGNLMAQRDFTDVRDIVKAYIKLIELGIPGETYNVGSGKARQIRQILDMIISFSECEICVEVDSNKIRPSDVPIIEADISKIHELTGWIPEISLEQTIKDTLDYWRKKVGE